MQMDHHTADLSESIERIRTLLRLRENRGIQREIAHELGISDQAVSQLIGKGNARVLARAAEKIAERRKRTQEDQEHLRHALEQLPEE